MKIYILYLILYLKSFHQYKNNIDLPFAQKSIYNDNKGELKLRNITRGIISNKKENLNYDLLEKNQIKINRNSINSSDALNPQLNKFKEKDFSNKINNINSIFNRDSLNSYIIDPEKNPIISNKKHVSKYAFKSQPGKNENGYTKTNQDNYLIMENILNSQEFKIFGVLDGHGKINKIFFINNFLNIKKLN